MAILKQRLSKRNAAGGYDPVYLETSSDLVLRPDGTTAEQSFTDIGEEIKSLSESASQPTDHASSHAADGSDPVTPAAIGAAAAAHNHDDAYAAKTHGHTEYAALSHTHSDYAPIRDSTFKGTTVVSKLGVGQPNVDNMYAQSVIIGSGGETTGLYGVSIGQSCIAGSKSVCIGHCTDGSGAYLAVGSYGKQIVRESGGDFTILQLGYGVSYPGAANVFRVTQSGNAYAAGSYNTSGADYAEYFEWVDGNPENEDRIGKFVTRKGSKIQIANPGDKILGIISGAPSVVGDVYDDQWQGQFLTDIYGRPVYNYVNNGELVERQRKLNPNYNPDEKYIPRSDRPEWGCVGLLGKIVMDDDGTANVDDCVTAGPGGVATKSDNETRFVVMERLDESHIRVFADIVLR